MPANESKGAMAATMASKVERGTRAAWREGINPIGDTAPKGIGQFLALDFSVPPDQKNRATGPPKTGSMEPGVVPKMGPESGPHFGSALQFF